MIQQGQQAIQELTQKVQALEADKSVDQFNAETQRMKVVGDLKNDQATTAISAASHLVKLDQPQPAQNPTRQG
jgi:hypothetical protein